MLAGGGGHGQVAALVADQEPDHHHRQRRRHLQRAGQRVASRRQRERHQDLETVVVQRAQHQVAQASGGEPERQPSARLAQQEQRHARDPLRAGVGGGSVVLPRRQSQEGKKNHHPEAVVEQ